MVCYHTELCIIIITDGFSQSYYTELYSIIITDGYSQSSMFLVAAQYATSEQFIERYLIASILPSVTLSS